MKDLYQKILNKPEIFRQRLAYGITAFLGLIIFAVWLSQTMLIMRETFNVDEDKEEVINQLKKNAPSLQTEQMQSQIPENLLENGDDHPSDALESEEPTSIKDDEGITNETGIKGLEILGSPSTETNEAILEKNDPIVSDQDQKNAGDSQEITGESTTPIQ